MSEKNIKTKKIITDQLFIMAGSFILAVGINVFLASNKISAGGVTTIGTVLLHLFGVRLSVTNLIANCLLFFFGYKSLGRYAVIETISGIIYLSLSLEITGLIPVFEGDLIIASVSGGALMGLGTGLVVRQGASTGGSDFAGLMLKKVLPHVSLATLIMVIDCVIVAISGVVFRSFDVTFYSFLALSVSSFITDKILIFGDKAKMIKIFTRKSDEIAKYIMETFGRGVTGVHCKGMYTGDEVLTLLCVVKPRELPRYVSAVKKIDPNAFIVIGEATEVLGEGFKEDG